MMECEIIKYTNHALEFMAARGISVPEVEVVINKGDRIEDYPDDKPFPSQLILAFIDDKPLHIVLANDTVNKICFVVTAYEPTLAKFESDFRTRKKK